MNRGVTIYFSLATQNKIIPLNIGLTSLITLIIKVNNGRFFYSDRLYDF